MITDKGLVLVGISASDVDTSGAYIDPTFNVVDLEAPDLTLPIDGSIIQPQRLPRRTGTGQISVGDEEKLWLTGVIVTAAAVAVGQSYSYSIYGGDTDTSANNLIGTFHIEGNGTNRLHVAQNFPATQYRFIRTANIGGAGAAQAGSRVWLGNSHRYSI